ncbi:MAG: ISL3 family transposase [Anaerolineae bacterium]|nr:ISL3 family transposase [Anaerolineae bacterium]
METESIQQGGKCPACQTWSQRLNGHYIRHPQDLPCVGYCVRLQLSVPRFFCDNVACHRRTFAGQFPGFVRRYGRRSERLTTQQLQIALITNGEAGSRLLQTFYMSASPDTLLRLVREVPDLQPETPRILGVDDWAKCKGQTYGTILVDLEENRVVDLFPDRTAEVLAEWLQNHPGVQIITRDRSTEYTRGINDGAPNAMQIADRWHLFLNAKQMLQRYFGRVYNRLKKLPAIEQTERAQSGEQNSKERAQIFPRTRRDYVQALSSRESRVEVYETIQQLRRAGRNIRQISRELGIARNTARIYFYSETFPERQRHQSKSSILDTYLAYLHNRVEQGCENASQLWRDIQAQGYPGTRSQVSKWLQLNRTKPSPMGPKKYMADSELKKLRQLKTEKAACDVPTIFEMVWVLIKEPAKLTDDEKVILNWVQQDPSVKKLSTEYKIVTLIVSQSKRRSVN